MTHETLGSRHIPKSPHFRPGSALFLRVERLAGTGYPPSFDIAPRDPYDAIKVLRHHSRRHSSRAALEFVGTACARLEHCSEPLSCRHVLGQVLVSSPEASHHIFRRVNPSFSHLMRFPFLVRTSPRPMAIHV